MTPSFTETPPGNRPTYPQTQGLWYRVYRVRRIHEGVFLGDRVHTKDDENTSG